MASFGHCPNCGGHYGMCTDHTVCRHCNCPPVGWKCPVCGAGLAPTTSRCPCVDGRLVPDPNQQTWQIGSDGQVVQVS